MNIVIGTELLPFCALSRYAELIAGGLCARGVGVRIHAFKIVESFGSSVFPLTKLLLTADEPNVLMGSLGDFPLLQGHMQDKVVWTMWESDVLRPDISCWLNRQRGIIVPTEWNAKTFRRSGVRVPIEIVPLGLDTQVFYPDVNVFPQKVFLTAGRSAHAPLRKGLDTVMLAFLTAFPTEKDVVLQVKTHPDCPVLDLHCPRIQIIKMHMEQSELVRWYREGLCYVSGSAAEGWGLHQHEAMACGKPLISVVYGGVGAFFDPKLHGWQIKHHLVLAEDAAYLNRGHWAKPDLYSMAAAMREAYENPYDTFMKGLQASVDVSKLTNTEMFKQLHHAIQSLLSRR